MQERDGWRGQELCKSDTQLVPGRSFVSGDWVICRDSNALLLASGPTVRPHWESPVQGSSENRFVFPSLQKGGVDMMSCYESQWSVYWRMCHACMERSVWEQYTVLNNSWEISPPSHGVKYGWLPTLSFCKPSSLAEEAGLRPPLSFQSVVDCSISWKWAMRKIGKP